MIAGGCFVVWGLGGWDRPTILEQPLKNDMVVKSDFAGVELRSTPATLHSPPSPRKHGLKMPQALRRIRKIAATQLNNIAVAIPAVGSGTPETEALLDNVSPKWEAHTV